MLHHYISKFHEGGRYYAEAWIQLDAFGRCWCFSRRRTEIPEGAADVPRPAGKHWKRAPQASHAKRSGRR